MNVYIITLCQGSDLYFYILDEANWGKLGDGPLCEALNNVEPLDDFFTLKAVFDRVTAEGWTVAATAEGAMY